MSSWFVPPVVIPIALLVLVVAYTAHRARRKEPVRDVARHLAGLLPRPGTSVPPGSTGVRSRWPAVSIFCIGIAFLLALMAARGSLPWP